MTKKISTAEILTAQENLKEMIKSIKGLSNYSEQNQKILLKKFSIENVKKYISIEKNYNKKIYTTELNNAPVYIKYCGLGLGVSRNPESFQVTNHTLYTFLDEYNLNPVDLTVYKKDK